MSRKDHPKFRLSPLAKSCQDCPLQKSPYVVNQVTTEYFPDANGKVDVMFIAEGPGASENTKGRPFIGRTGRLLRRVVRRLTGDSQVGIAYGNIVRCRPTKQDRETNETRDRAPTATEIKCCRPSIWRDIKRLRPKAIVLLGDSAAKGLACNRDGSPLAKTKVGMMRGKDFAVKLPGGQLIPAVVTYHFSYVYRTPEVASVFREDSGKVLRRVRGQLDDYSERGRETVMLDTIPKVKKFLGHLIKGLTKDDIVAFDYETTDVTRLNNSVLTMSFAYQTDRAYCVPVGHPESPFGGAEVRQLKKLMRKFFRVRHPSFRALVPHNLKFEDLVTLDWLGTHILLPVEDTFQRAHSLNEDRKGAVGRPYGLKVLAEEQLGFYHYDDDDIAPIVRLRNEGRLREAPLDGLVQYNGMDSYCTYRLFRWQDQWAQADGYLEGFTGVSQNLHGSIGQFLAEMERNGLLADIDRVRELMSDDSDIQARMRAIEVELFGLESVKETNRRLLGGKQMRKGLHANRQPLWLFKLGNVDSKRTLFFEVLKLEPVSKSRKTGRPSIDKVFFEKYEGVQEIDLYQEYGQLQKILSTYVKSIHKFLHNDPDMMVDGRVRPHYKPTGTITGRISSSEPNMLNIPSRSKTEAAKAIKRLYIVPPGYCLVCADYSQAEVRWLAEATQDPFLVQAFRDAYEAKRICRLDPTEENKRRSALEGDFHRHTASMINEVSLQEVTDDQRQASKTVVFGLVYGMSIQGLASRLGISQNKAEAFIDAFFARFPTAKKWLDKMERTGFRSGYVLSPTGRRKLINSWFLLGNDDPDRLPRHLRRLQGHHNHEMRVCRNAPIQGVASDTNLLACSQLLDHILRKKCDWKIINTVYDSIMIEVPYPEVANCIETTQGIMEDPKLFSPFGLQPRVPFAADFSVGVNWGDQYDVAYDVEKWTVACNKCDETRTEKQRPTNRRCEECGSTRVRRTALKAPLDLLLQQLDRDHGLSELWG